MMGKVLLAIMAMMILTSCGDQGAKDRAEAKRIEADTRIQERVIDQSLAMQATAVAQSDQLQRLQATQMIQMMEMQRAQATALAIPAAPVKASVSPSVIGLDALIFVGAAIGLTLLALAISLVFALRQMAKRGNTAVIYVNDDHPGRRRPGQLLCPRQAYLRKLPRRKSIYLTASDKEQ
jgi:hypothetical protein